MFYMSLGWRGHTRNRGRPRTRWRDDFDSFLKYWHRSKRGSVEVNGEGLRPTTDIQRLKLKLWGRKIHLSNAQKFLELYSLLYKNFNAFSSVKFRILLLWLINSLSGGYDFVVLRAPDGRTHLCGQLLDPLVTTLHPLKEKNLKLQVYKPPQLIIGPSTRKQQQNPIISPRL